MTFEDWRRVLSTNLDSVFLVSSALRARHETARLGPRRQHGVEHLRLGGDRLRALCHQQGRHHGLHAGAGQRARPHGITVNAIAPSLTRTPGALARKPRAGIASIDEEFELVAQSQSIKRVEVPDDLVGTVSYLTSDDAAFVTGQMINVNGGRIFS